MLWCIHNNEAVAHVLQFYLWLGAWQNNTINQTESAGLLLGMRSTATQTTAALLGQSTTTTTTSLQYTTDAYTTADG